MLRQFAGFEHRRGMARSSIDKRVAVVRRWVDHVGDPFDAGVDWRAVERFVDATNTAAATSRYAIVSHLHRFYIWAMRDGRAAADPTVLVVRPRIRPGLPRPISDVDLAVAVGLADPVMRAALLVAALCGARCVEICRLEWVDVGFTAMRLTGKGGRQRYVPMPGEVVDALEQLERVDGWVFPWREDRSSSPGRRASHAIRDYLRSVGVTASAHQLRHWCGTNAYRATGDLAAVQDYLGHASPATTRVYAAMDPTRLQHVADALASPAPAVPAAIPS